MSSLPNKVQLIDKNAFATPPINVFRDVDMVQIRNIINALTNLIGEILVHPALNITFATKTGNEAGELFEMAIDDDYLYICVENGDAGYARWKRVVLTQISS
jgi:hypothetical protein